MMDGNFNALDFPEYDELTYQQARPLLWGVPGPTVGVIAEVLRSTLSRKRQREFDSMRLADVVMLVEDYVDIQNMRQEVYEFRTEPSGGDTA